MKRWRGRKGKSVDVSVYYVCDRLNTSGLVFCVWEKYMVWTRGRISPRCVNKNNIKKAGSALRTDRFWSKRIKSSGKSGRPHKIWHAARRKSLRDQSPEQVTR